MPANPPDLSKLKLLMVVDATASACLSADPVPLRPSDSCAYLAAVHVGSSAQSEHRTRSQYPTVSPHLLTSPQTTTCQQPDRLFKACNSPLSLHVQCICILLATLPPPTSSYSSDPAICHLHLLQCLPLHQNHGRLNGAGHGCRHEQPQVTCLRAAGSLVPPFFGWDPREQRPIAVVVARVPGRRLLRGACRCGGGSCDCAGEVVAGLSAGPDSSFTPGLSVPVHQDGAWRSSILCSECVTVCK